MIFQAIDTIRQELAASLGPTTTVNYGNIVEIIGTDSGSTGTQSDVIISLINIEENRISRDPHNYIRQNGGILMKNPAVHLYLTLLFTSVRHTDAYGLALQDLQKVIGFFQKKFYFDRFNTQSLLSTTIEELILDMVSLNLQQLHEIWSVLGGRYYPSVVYRMRMVTIDNIDELSSGPMILETESEFYQM